MGNSRVNPIAQLARRGDYARARELKIKQLISCEESLQYTLRMVPADLRPQMEAALRSVTGLVTPESGSKPAETSTHNEPATIR